VHAPFGDVLRDLLCHPIGQQQQPEGLGQTCFQIDAVIDLSLFAVCAKDRLASEVTLR
jgi:hypothetical protein